jgi:transcriptional regulator of met regulon
MKITKSQYNKVKEILTNDCMAIAKEKVKELYPEYNSYKLCMAVLYDYKYLIVI